MNRQFRCVVPYGDYTIRDGIVYSFFKKKVEEKIAARLILCFIMKY